MEKSEEALKPELIVEESKLPLPFPKDEKVKKVLQDPLEKVKTCDALWQKSIPQFGMYSDEYQWFDPISAIKCNASDFVFSKVKGKSEIDSELYV